MNLMKKRNLAAKVLKIGKNRVYFSPEGISEIKKAITKQDIRDLFSQGIITIKPVKGRRKIEKSKRRKGPGKINVKVNKRKQIYVKITRKLRKYLKKLRKSGKIENKLYWQLRKKIKMKEFKSESNLKEYIRGISKEIKSKKTKK